MKFGLLVYPETYALCNLGDYIQSIAARQFLPHVDAYIGREELDTYTGDPTRVILNGWFMHSPRRWPPSSSVHPLFVSFHINSVARSGMDTVESIEYLKSWQPIGCRDWDTVRWLRERGVEAYFSACLTLTLGRSFPRRSGTEVIFVEPHYDVLTDVRSVVRYLWDAAFHWDHIRTIGKKMFGDRLGFRGLLRAAVFYSTYKRLFAPALLANATYVTQEVPSKVRNGHAAKFAEAERLLRQYASARFVVTSRIHCALPCLGMGTPVLYVEDQDQAETSRCRLDGLRALLRVVQSRRGRLHLGRETSQIDGTSVFANPTEWRSIAERLATAVEAFVEGRVAV